MGDILSLIAIAVLMILIVISVRRQRAVTAHDDEELQARIGTDDAQHARSADQRARVRAAQSG